MAPRLDAEAALRHLATADPVLARVIAAAGPFKLRDGGGDPFRSLSVAIISQQLSGKASGTIYRRFLALFDPARGEGPPPAWEDLLANPFPEPAAVLALDETAMRGAGLSRQKTAALKDLAAHFASGELSVAHFDAWSDEEVIAHLTRVRGIGRWTAEMYLMFHLQRPDVLPVNDVGINRAIRRLYGLEALPGPAEIRAIGAPWRPWATVACWYLWEYEDARPPGAT